MILNKVEDPRDTLAKARRWELVQLAKANGVSEIDADMPADLMRTILRQKGVTRVQIPPRPLGQQNQPNARKMYRNGQLLTPPPAPARQEQQKVVEVNADADLMRQWQQERAAQKNAEAAPAKPLDQMGINELRNECKRLGIHVERRDNMQTMKAKIEAHGQNAA